MDPHFALSHAPDHRPFAFLVSTTPCAGSIRETMGAPAYSYYFVVEALAPVLETLGTWRLVEHPESRLAFAAAKAEAEGFRPVHLAVNPLQDVYFSQALPNIVFPFWEFPEIPARDFGFDTRQNWARLSRSASLILTACRFTAQAFRRSGVSCPVAVVPVPLAPEAFALPPWEREHTWTLTCRHEELGAEADHEAIDGPELGVAGAECPGLSDDRGTGPRDSPFLWRAARGGFRRVAPWLDPNTLAGLTRLKRSLARKLAGRRNPAALGFVILRHGYRKYVRRWLNDEAVEGITRAKNRALAAVGRGQAEVHDPPLPSGALTLGGGLVYLTIFNVGDRRKNYHDMLTAFLTAFRDRPDVTLVVKLVTNRRCEGHEAGLLRDDYRALGMPHRCRVVVVTEFLTEPQMDELFRVTTFYVNTSHAEGACLPLMRSLAGGRPAVAPDHTAMADYMDRAVGFVPRSHPEPTHWPHDPEKRFETSRHRLVWTDLRDAFLASAAVADHDPARLAALAAAARSRMTALAGRSSAAAALREALDLLPESHPLATGRAGHRVQPG